VTDEVVGPPAAHATVLHPSPAVRETQGLLVLRTGRCAPPQFGVPAADCCSTGCP
jgi:hypothetical protein